MLQDESQPSAHAGLRAKGTLHTPGDYHHPPALKYSHSLQLQIVPCFLDNPVGQLAKQFLTNQQLLR